MDKDPFDALALGHIQHREDVGQVAMHAAVGQKPEDMQRLSVRLRVMDRLQINGVFKELPFLDLLGDLREDLEHDAAGADVGMADLGVAHLAGGKADIQTGGLKLGMGIPGKEPVQIGLLRLGDGIARCGRGNAVAVHDDENCAVFNLGLHTVQP